MKLILAGIRGFALLTILNLVLFAVRIMISLSCSDPKREWITNLYKHEPIDWCYAKHKKIGRPRATESLTAEELEEHGIVGLYGVKK